MDGITHYVTLVRQGEANDDTLSDSAYAGQS